MHVIVACQVLTRFPELCDVLRQGIDNVNGARSRSNDARERKAEVRADFTTLGNISRIQSSASPYPCLLCDCIVLYLVAIKQRENGYIELCMK